MAFRSHELDPSRAAFWKHDQNTFQSTRGKNLDHQITQRWDGTTWGTYSGPQNHRRFKKWGRGNDIIGEAFAEDTWEQGGLEDILFRDLNHPWVVTSWWFGTSIWFFHILEIIIPMVEVIFFRGVGLNHQPALEINVFFGSLRSLKLLNLIWIPNLVMTNIVKMTHRNFVSFASSKMVFFQIIVLVWQRVNTSKYQFYGDFHTLTRKCIVLMLVIV